jgi:hypothetical protein
MLLDTEVYLPLIHGLHATAPDDAENIPASHATQDIDPVLAA